MPVPDRVDADQQAGEHRVGERGAAAEAARREQQHDADGDRGGAGERERPGPLAEDRDRARGREDRAGAARQRVDEREVAGRVAALQEHEVDGVRAPLAIPMTRSRPRRARRRRARCRPRRRGSCRPRRRASATTRRPRRRGPLGERVPARVRESGDEDEQEGERRHGRASLGSRRPAPSPTEHLGCPRVRLEGRREDELESKSAKYIFITGGVVSSLGKGITAASLGTLLKARGLKVGVQKLDPYMNVDPGTMSPYQHGEVFVTEDGPRPTSTSATTSASSTRTRRARRTRPPAASTTPSSAASARASTSARPSR